MPWPTDPSTWVGRDGHRSLYRALSLKGPHSENHGHDLRHDPRKEFGHRTRGCVLNGGLSELHMFLQECGPLRCCLAMLQL